MSCRKIFLDGKIINASQGLIDSLVPGVLKGRGVFETLRVKGGKICLLEKHLDRMTKGLKLYRLSSPYSKKQWEQHLNKVLKANGCKHAGLRLQVWKERQQVRAAIVCRRRQDVTGPGDREGYKAVISEIRRLKTRYSHIKSLDYFCFRAAYLDAARRGYDEALLLNSRGEFVEGSRTNVFFVRGKTLFTPAVSCGCLNGITRRNVLLLARRLGVRCKAGCLDFGFVKAADEAFVTNALIGVMPLVSVNDLPIGNGKPGPVTLQLQNMYAADLRASARAASD